MLGENDVKGGVFGIKLSDTSSKLGKVSLIRVKTGEPLMRQTVRTTFIF